MKTIPPKHILLEDIRLTHLVRAITKALRKKYSGQKPLSIREQLATLK